MPTTVTYKNHARLQHSLPNVTIKLLAMKNHSIITNDLVELPVVKKKNAPATVQTNNLCHDFNSLFYIMYIMYPHENVFLHNIQGPIFYQ